MKILSDLSRPHHAFPWNDLARRYIPRSVFQSVRPPPKAGPAFNRFSYSIRGNHILVGVALLLGSVLAAEVQAILAEEHDPHAVFPHAVAMVQSAQTMPVNSTQPGTVASEASVILSRPLLSPRRLPITAKAGNDAQPTPRLTGIIITADEKIGIFSLENGKPVIVREGGRVGSFKLLSIAADGAQLQESSGVTTLHIAYDRNRAVEDAATTPLTADEDAAFPGSNAWPTQ